MKELIVITVVLILGYLYSRMFDDKHDDELRKRQKERRP